MIESHRSLCVVLALLVTAVSSCSSQDKCARLVDTMIKCETDPELKAQTKEFRAKLISECRSTPKATSKDKIACGAKRSCQEFLACSSAIGANKAARKIEGDVAAGKYEDAIGYCLHKRDAYGQVPALTEACDKAINRGFSKIDKLFVLRGWCKNQEGLSSIAALKGQCDTWFDRLEKSVTDVRDAGDRLDGKKCYDLKAMNRGGEKRLARINLLCAEAELAPKVAEAIAGAKKNLANKKMKLPFACQAFLDAGKELAESEWYQVKVKEVANVCIGDLGKKMLYEGKVCTDELKKVYDYALAYKLTEQDPALAKLVAKCQP